MKKLLVIVASILLLFANIIPAYATTVEVTVATDKSDYQSGEKVIVTGTVLKDGMAGKGTKPSLTVTNSNGTIIQTQQWSDANIEKDGKISTTISLGKIYVTGSYTIKISATSATAATKTITVKGDGTDPGTPPTDPVTPPTNPGTPPPTGPVTPTPPTNPGTPTDPVKPTPTPPTTPETEKPTPDLAPKKPTINKVTSISKTITGKAEKNTIVTITDKKKFKVETTTLNNGTFSVKLTAKIKEGTVLYVVAKNKETNKISAEVKTTVADKTAPSTPKVNKVSTKTTKVTGKAEAKAKVYVKVGSKIVGVATVTSKGNYSVSIKKQKAKTVLSIYAKDKAGNLSKVVKTSVK